MGQRTLFELENYTKMVNLICTCGNAMEIPNLWLSVICSNCGEPIENKDVSGVRAVLRKALTWAGIDPETLGYTLGDPRLLPSMMRDQLEKKSGLVFFSLDDTFIWECQHCSTCCGLAGLFDSCESAVLSDADRISLQLGEGITKLTKNPETGCCSYMKDNLCTKHGVRPTFCRLFPLGCMFLERSGIRVQYLCLMGPECPGLLQGKQWTVREWLLTSGCLHKFFSF